jgi:hypothetical protein
MLYRNSIGAIAIMALLVSTTSAQIFDYSKYPNLKGRWDRFVVRTAQGGGFDQTKSEGFAQQAPLTPEYQKNLEESVADQAAGGHGNNLEHIRCTAVGMPFMMVAFRPLEFIVTPDVTYIIIADYDPLRRIFTDGRDWPKEIEPTFAGYSIGKWIDEGNTGRYNVLEIETRGFKGPRTYDNSGLPLDKDNESVIYERIFQDKANPNLMYDQITTMDHALTKPWSATKTYRRAQYDHPVWHESVCAENNPHVEIAGQGYMLSADGFLMPAKKDQPPPDLKYFKPRAN